MLVHDLPLPADPPATKGGAHPDIGRFATRSFSRNSIEAVTKSHVFAGSDFQVAQLVADRTLEGRKPCLPVFPISVCSLILERCRKIEDHDVACVMRHDSVNVLGAECLRPLLHESVNLRLIARFLVFHDWLSFPA
jgi:hypothetical protein